MRTEVEAPVTEPRSREAASTSTGVRKAFGDVVALDGVDLRVARGRARRGRRAERLREVDAARARVRARRRRTPGRVDAPPAALMPQRDALLPWLTRARQRGAGAAGRRARRKAEARAAAHAHFARVRARGLRAGAARGAQRRDAPARRVPAHAARRAGRCCAWTSRSRALDALTRAQTQTLARRGARARAAHRAAGHARRRGGGAARRPRSCCSRRAPAGSSPTLDVAAAAPARAHRPRRGRAARARAGARSG